MIHKIIKKTSCSNCIDCSDSILDKLENEFKCKLHVNKNIIEVHGSLSILHEEGNHIVTVNFYEKNQLRENTANIKKLGKIPSKEEIKKII